jgi:hypothetical protein
MNPHLRSAALSSFPGCNTIHLRDVAERAAIDPRLAPPSHRKRLGGY